MPNSKLPPQSKGPFYKYRSASAAKSVLDTCSLRWSSPLLFNDPFDAPRELFFGVNDEAIAKAVVARLVSLVESPRATNDGLSPEIAFLMDNVRTGLSDATIREIRESMQESLASLAQPSKSMEELRALWRLWLPDFRILCLTESPRHSAMWNHYADRYKGAVLEFEVKEHLSSAWLLAKRVDYLESGTLESEAARLARYMTMPLEVGVRTILEESTYRKSTDWSYEGEWRITTFKRPHDEGLFTDYKFSKEELSAIYFGPLILPEDREALLASATAYPNARLVDVKISMGGTFLFTDLA